MKSWRIHLVWSVITLVSSAAWAQRAVRTREIEFREREKVLQVRIVEAKKIAPSVVSEPAPAPAAPISPIALLEKPAAEYEVEPQDLPTLEEIRKLMQSETDGWRAYQVIQRMVRCPLKAELVQELLRSKDPEIRRATMYMVLETLGSEAAAPIFQECLRSDASAIVREQAAEFLGPPAHPGNVEALLQALQKDELKVQLACAGALSGLGQPGPASQLFPRIAAMLDNPDGALRREAVGSLAKLRCPEAVTALTRALHDTNGDVRLEAVNALFNFEDSLTLSVVEPLLNDPVEGVRDSAKSLTEQLKSRKP